MKYALLALLSAGWIAGASAQCDSYTILDTEFPSVQTAALMALGDVLSRNVETEYGGVILEKDGKFHYTVAITQGGSDRVSYCAPTRGPWRVVAFYHTHPEIPLFSEIDKNLAKERGVPSYIATMRALEGKYHVIARYDPRTNATTLIATAENNGPRDVLFSRYEAETW